MKKIVKGNDFTLIKKTLNVKTNYLIHNYEKN